MCRHAEVVLADREVNLSFLRHCRIGYDHKLQQERACISDEHLIPSLLASLGEDKNTTCDWGGGTYVDWSAGDSHPRTFGLDEVERGEHSVPSVCFHNTIVPAFALKRCFC